VWCKPPGCPPSRAVDGRPRTVPLDPLALAAPHPTRHEGVTGTASLREVYRCLLVDSGAYRFRARRE